MTSANFKGHTEHTIIKIEANGASILECLHVRVYPFGFPVGDSLPCWNCITEPWSGYVLTNCGCYVAPNCVCTCADGPCSYHEGTGNIRDRLVA